MNFTTSVRILSCKLAQIELTQSMLALTRRGSLCLRPHFATAISAPRNSLCSSRGIHFRSGSTNSCKEPVCKSSSSFAIAVSCAALGGFFLTQQTARSDSGHPPPIIVASAPPSSQSFALSGTVPSGASPFNLSYSAGTLSFSSALIVLS